MLEDNVERHFESLVAQLQQEQAEPEPEDAEAAAAAAAAPTETAFMIEWLDGHIGTVDTGPLINLTNVMISARPAGGDCLQ